MKESLRHFLYGHKRLYSFASRLKCIFDDLKMIRIFKAQSVKHQINERIKVAFLCQYIPAWNKFQPLYDSLMSDSRFDPYIICLPMNIQNNTFLGEENYNDVFDYYQKNGYKAINAMTDINQWIDLEIYNFDYVVYTRPYNSYLPKAYITQNVCKYSKVVTMMYATNLLEDNYDVLINHDFFEPVYAFFADTERAKDFFRAKYPISTSFGFRKCEYLGMLGFEQMMADKEKTSTSWNFAGDGLRAIWTPRWTTQQELGGSNFFVYYESLLDYAEKHKNFNLLIRPHPLAFDNFLKTGEITKESLDEYIKRVDLLPNVAFDENKEYGATFWESDVLISDISGIMPEYFITGKPLVYCSSNMYLKLAVHTEKMLEGCYDAPGPKELFDYLDIFLDGKDPTYESRQSIVNSFYDGSKISTRIAGRMYEYLNS